MPHDINEKEVITALNARIQKLEQENDGFQRTFDLQWRRMQEAAALWREANPGNEHVFPDLGRLLEWLMSQIQPKL